MLDIPIADIGSIVASGGNKVELSLRQLPHILESLSHLKGMPLVLTITAPPEVMSSLLALLHAHPSRGKAAALPPQPQPQQLPRAGGCGGNGNAAALDDSQPEDLWEELSQRQPLPKTSGRESQRIVPRRKMST